MNEELALRAEQALEDTIGPPGRILALSKSGYLETHSGNVVVFNANIAVKGGKISFCDVDLSIDEPKLLALAARLGETVYVLSERDGRFANEDAPLLERAVYSATPDGHTRYQPKWIERGRDGRLQRRPSPP